MRELLTIGELAQQAEVAASTLRYYENVGLLPAPIRISGQRRYTSDILKRLSFIRLAQQAGFTVAELKILLQGFETTTPPLSQWRLLVQQKLDEVEAMIQRSQQMKDLLEEGLRCGCFNYDECYAKLMAGEHC
jgi:MerR family redox-sensitive transcriptional activator SoxR